MSLDGSTIKVNSLQPQDSEVNHEGRTHIFDRSGSTWVHKVTLAPFHAGDFCSTVRMSGDGRTLVANCFVPNGNVFRAVTLKRVGDAWVHAADLTSTSFTERSAAGAELRRDGDGAAARRDTQYSVGVYRWDGSAWVREANLFRAEQPRHHSGCSAYPWHSAATASGSPSAISRFRSAVRAFRAARIRERAIHGAVFLYQRDGAPASPWQLHSVVKAPNPGRWTLFGLSVALSWLGANVGGGRSHGGQQRARHRRRSDK